MKQVDLENYIGQLLNIPEVDEGILAEVPNAKLLLTAYRLGLEGKPLHTDLFMRELELEKDIPAPFHTAVAQIAILKSKKGEPRAVEYLRMNVESLLKEFRNYFLTKSSNE